MKTLKQLETSAYILKSLMKSHPVYQLANNYKFADKNRGAFANYLNTLKPKDNASRAWLDHLKSVNLQCDKDSVFLLQDEFDKLKQTYFPGASTTTLNAMKNEAALFSANAVQFKEGTLNHDLRAYRPDFPSLFDGEINF